MYGSAVRVRSSSIISANPSSGCKSFFNSFILLKHTTQSVHTQTSTHTINPISSPFLHFPRSSFRILESAVLPLSGSGNTRTVVHHPGKEQHPRVWLNWTTNDDRLSTRGVISHAGSDRSICRSAHLLWHTDRPCHRKECPQNKNTLISNAPILSWHLLTDSRPVSPLITSVLKPCNEMPKRDG